MSNASPKRLTPSQEDYLEAILALVGEGGVARVRDIAGRLGVGKSAVSGALKTLSKRKMVNYDPYEFITLTPRGEQMATKVRGRHEALRRFLTSVLGLDEQTAEANACRMEHSMEDVVLDRLNLLADFLGTRSNPAGPTCLGRFESFLRGRSVGNDGPAEAKSDEVQTEQ